MSAVPVYILKQVLSVEHSSIQFACFRTLSTYYFYRTMSTEPLEYLSVEKWVDLQNVFKKDWPRGSPTYTLLETQRKLLKQGYDYGFRVYCVNGDLCSGMVAVNDKNDLYEIIIQCPEDDTEKLEEALKRTKIINWDRTILLAFAPQHVVECVKRAIQAVDVEIIHMIPSERFILNKYTPLFKDISLPASITFDRLTLEHLDLIDTTWPHRYPTSRWFFQLLIDSKNGYGLFLNGSLISWVLINEAGALCHMYTVEEQRQKGYAELLVKLICNKELEEGRDVLVFCVKGNLNACKLYNKVGFTQCEGVSWCFLNKKK